MTTTVATWMYAESRQEEGAYAQVPGRSSDFSTQAVYWRCVYCFFEFAHRAFQSTPDVRFRLYSNVSQLPSVDGLDLNEALLKLNVEVVQLAYTRKPAGARKQWFNQFYVFDIFEHWLRLSSESDAIILADSDCFFVGSQARLLDRLEGSEVLVIDVDTTVDEDINGISRKEAAEALSLAQELGPAPYFGGEFYGITHRRLKRVLAGFEELYAWNNARAQSGQLYLSDEAHLFSALLARDGIRAATANDLAKRIWTGLRVNNTRPEDLQLAAWHVPAEKTYGIAHAFHKLAAKPDVLMELPDDALRKFSAGLFGVGRMTTRKFFGHGARTLSRKFQKLYNSVSQSRTSRN